MRRLSLLASAVLLAGITLAGEPAGAVRDTTELVSADRDGEHPSVSADGRWVAFESDGGVHVRDRATGALVAITPGADGESRRPALSPDGRYVAFDTTATNLPGVPGNDGGPVVVVADRDPDGDGVLDERGRDGVRYLRLATAGDALDIAPSVSADAGVVVWTRRYRFSDPVTVLTELGRDAGGRLRELGDQTDLRPTDPEDRYVLGSGAPARVSADGTRVVFPAVLCESFCGAAFAGPRLLSLNGRRAQPLPRTPAVFTATVHPLAMSLLDTGATDPVLSSDGATIAYVRDGRVVVAGAGGAREIAPGSVPSVSGDGRYLTYRAPDLVALDLVAGATRPVAHSGAGAAAALDEDGATVVFDSLARLVAADGDDSRDVYAHTFRPALTGAEVDFGEVRPGTAATALATVRHNGFGPVHVSAVAVDGHGFTALPGETCGGRTLHAGDECAVPVHFDAGNGGDRTAALVLATSSGPALVPLRAESTVDAPGRLAAEPASVVFPGEHIATTASEPAAVTLSNTGTTPVTVTGVSLLPGPHAGDFTVTGCAGQTVQPGGRCVVAVVATPRGGGPRTATLVVDTTGTPGSLVVGLRATGATPALAVNPAVSAAGRVLTVSGANYPPGRIVTVSGTAFLTARVVADRTGRFALPSVVVGNVPAGQATITAAVTGTEVAAQARVLVVAGTFQPPGFHGRR